jgi:hypothetical protein
VEIAFRIPLDIGCHIAMHPTAMSRITVTATPILIHLVEISVLAASACVQSAVPLLPHQPTLLADVGIPILEERT